MTRFQALGTGSALRKRSLAAMPAHRWLRPPGRAAGSRLWRVIAVASLIFSSMFFDAALATAAAPPSIKIQQNPTTVYGNQPIEYSVTIANTGGATATGLSLTNTWIGVGPGATTAWVASSLGTCSYADPTLTCSASSLAANQTWTVTITGAVTAAAGATVSSVATLTGTEGSTFSVSSSASSVVAGPLAPGFTQTRIAGGLSNPIVLAFAPNGDIYIGQQNGTISVYRNGAVLATPLGTIPNVYGQYECGLTGMALDPNFASNGYIYVSYVWATTNSSGAAVNYSRLSRFTVVNGALDVSTEKVYYQGNQAQNQHHPGQTVKIGPDGKLWWSVGDNVPTISNGPTLQNIYGKMLRFNLDGSVPADNPFVNVANAVPYIYAYGLRNPFRFNFLPNGQAMTEDTGSSYAEELDTIQAGGFYGWDYYEGNCFTCGAINPAYAYGHVTWDGAASALAPAPASFPQQYAHTVFVGDYVRQDIQAVTFDSMYRTVVSDTVFDDAAGTIADLEVGPDGNLYYVSIFSGSVYRIAPTGPFAPTAAASATPSAGLSPLNVQFSSAGSSDPLGGALAYDWSFGDGSPDSTAANPSHQYSADGTYTATLTVSGSGGTDTSTVKVTAGHNAPTLSVSVPSTYTAGQTIGFSGSATDDLDGAEPATAFTWKVDFYDNGVLRPSWVAGVPGPFAGPFNGVTSGSFTIPTDPSQTPTSFYRLTATVTDSLGITTTVTRDLHPATTSWSVSGNVLGPGYFVDGTWHTGPFSTTDVVGVKHILTGEPLAQKVGSTRYRFSGFADGSALEDHFTSTAASQSFGVNFDAVGATMPSGWTTADMGSPITTGGADYSSSSGTFYLDGSGADVYGPNVQFRYAYQPLTGDGTITARVRFQSNSDPWAKAGLLIAGSPSTGSPFVDALVAPDVSPTNPNINGFGCTVNGCVAPLQPVTPAMGNGARLQYSTASSIAPASYPTGFTSPNKWLRLQRKGNVFTAWMSPDGSSWTQIGATSVSMASTVSIGLFVTSHDIGQLSTVAFDNVSVSNGSTSLGPLPSGWNDADVGAPAIAGSAGFDSGTFTVNGAGADIYGTSDQFNLASTTMTGDGSISGRVATQTNTSSSAKAGLMVRTSTDAGSPYYAAFITPSKGIVVQWRNSAGATTSQSPKVTATAPVFLRITRTGSQFTAFWSTDGLTWASIP